MASVSIVIATYNRAASLERTLRSLARQQAPLDAWEAVVVDNNSADDTQQRFAAFAAAHPHLPLRMVREPRQGLSHARNRGIAESRGEVIAIIDDDEEVNEGFVTAYADFFARHPQVAAAGGRIVAVYEAGRPRWMTPYAEVPIANPIDLGPRERPFPGRRCPGGGNMALRRSALERYGLFDPALGRTGTKLVGGEETDLFARLRRSGQTAWYVPGAVIRHHISASRLTRSYLMRLSRMIGVSERVRTRREGSYPVRLAREVYLWAGTLALAAAHTFTLHPSKGGYLILMRWQITKGLLDLCSE